MSEPAVPSAAQDSRKVAIVHWKSPVRPRWAPASTGIAVAFALLMTALLLPFASAAGPAPGATGSAFTCKVVFGSTPDALLIPGTGPTGTAPSGTVVGFHYEFEVLNYAGGLSGHTVYLPSATVTFTTSSGSVQIFDLKHNLTISGASWTNPASSDATHKFASATALTSGTTPTLSTQKLAVMANDGFGTIDLAFRWQWTVSYPNGTNTAGAWTVPNATMAHPSIFYAAPFVSVLAHTASPVTIGTNYTATLSGAISKEPFFLELEYASSGHVVMSKGDTAPAGNSTPFVAAIPFESYDGNLAPATMLVHVHNHCGSMLASISATGAYASSATVTLTTNNTACGTIDYNGHAYSAGTHLTVTPSSTAVAIGAPTCSGHAFSDWTATPDLDVITKTHSGTTAIVTYSGTLEAHYA